MADDVFNASLIYREDVTDDLSIVRFAPDHGPVPSFEPGQFAMLGLPKPPPESATPQPSARRDGRPRLFRRAYSIASSPTERDSLEFYLVRVEDGRLTSLLWEVHEGGRVWMDDHAKGHFTLDGIPGDADVVMVATGTGLAPYISMVRRYRGRGRWRRCVIVQGARCEADLGYRAELEHLAANDPTIVYIPAVTREPAESSWQGHRGRVQTVLEPDAYENYVGEPLDPDRCHVMLCGNPLMIEGVRESLEGRGFVTDRKDQPGNIHFERYW